MPQEFRGFSDCHRAPPSNDLGHWSINSARTILRRLFFASHTELYTSKQCCGSGSSFLPPRSGFQDPGWSNGRIRIRDKQTKFVNSLYIKIGRIRDPGSSAFLLPGSRIWDPNPWWSNGQVRDKTSRIRNTASKQAACTWHKHVIMSGSPL
jgi:hypothetical protein